MKTSKQTLFAILGCVGLAFPAAPATAMDMVPHIELPAMGTNPKTFWESHPYNPVNRPGYNASTNPRPALAFNTPGRDANGNTVNPVLPGYVITAEELATTHQNKISVAIKARATQIDTHRWGNVTVVLSPGVDYAAAESYSEIFDKGYTPKIYSNIAIICPDAAYSPGADGIPDTADDADTRPIMGRFRIRSHGGPSYLVNDRFYFWFDAALAGVGSTFNNSSSGSDIRTITQDDVDLALTMMRNPGRNWLFQNIRVRHTGDYDYSSEMNRMADVLFMGCSFKSTYPRVEDKHHRGTVFGNTGLFNIGFLDCQFLGNSENVIYLDGAHTTVLNNCVFKMQGWDDARPDRSDGYDMGLLFLTNEDFTDAGIWEPYDYIDVVEEVAPKYQCVVDNHYINTGIKNQFFCHQGENFLLLDNRIDGTWGYGIRWDSRAGKDKAATDPYFFYNHHGAVIEGNTISAVNDYFLWLAHDAITSPNSTQDDVIPWMGGFRIAGNTIGGSFDWFNPDYAPNHVPSEALPYYYGPEIIGGNRINGAGLADRTYGTENMLASEPAPANVRVHAVTPTQVDVFWEENVANEYGFIVEYSSDGGNSWSYGGGVRRNFTAHSVKNLAPGASYQFRVVPVSSFGRGPASAQSLATPAVGIVPAVGFLAAEAVANYAVRLTWDLHADDLDSVLIERSSDNGLTWLAVATAAGNATWITDWPVAKETSYLYRATAFRGGEPSPSSNIAAVTTPAANPNLFKNGSLEDIPVMGVNGSFPAVAVAAHWGDGSTTQRTTAAARTGSASYLLSSTTAASSTKYVGTKPDAKPTLEPGVSYVLSLWYRTDNVSVGAGIGMRMVETAPVTRLYTSAHSRNTSGSWQQKTLPFTISADFTGKPSDSRFELQYSLDVGESALVDDLTLTRAEMAETAPASAPSAPQVAQAGPDGARITWGDATGNENYFRIEVSTGSGWSTVATAPRDATGVNVEGLAAGGTYDFRVFAVNPWGDSPASATVGITMPVPGIPTAPSGLAATAAGYYTMNLTWTDNSSDETGFRIECSADSGTTWATIAHLAANATSFTDTGLAAGTAYSYRVRGIGPAGLSSPSATASAATASLAPNFVPNSSLETVHGSDPLRALAWYRPTSMQRDGTTAHSGSYSYRNDGSYSGSDGYLNIEGFENATYGGTKLSPGTQYEISVWYKMSGVATGGSNGIFLSLIQYNSSNTKLGQSSSSRVVDNSGTWQRLAFTLTTNSAYDHGTLRIYITAESGDTIWIDDLEVRQVVAIPSQPTNLAVSSPAPDSATLTWTDTSSNETGFLVQRSSGNGTWVDVATTAANATSFTVTGLSSATAHAFRVIARNATASAGATAPVVGHTRWDPAAPLTADSDADGVSDFFVYAFGLRGFPAGGVDPAGLPEVWFDQSASRLKVRFNQPEVLPDDLDYLVECSDDLATWESYPVDGEDLVVETTANENGTVTLVTTDPDTRPAPPRRFLRVKVRLQ